MNNPELTHGVVHYDDVIFRACPHYEFAIDTAVSLIPDNAINVVSLGTGTGNLESRVMTIRPYVRLTGYEKDEDYIQIATSKLRGRANIILADLADVTLPPADVVITSLTLHHLTHDVKKRVFRCVSKSLLPGGRFINFDIVKARSLDEHEDFVNFMLSFMHENGLPEEFIREERDVLNGIGEGADMPMDLEEQLLYLEKLGLRCSTLWREKLLSIYMAEKV